MSELVALVVALAKEGYPPREIAKRIGRPDKSKSVMVMLSQQRSRGENIPYFRRGAHIPEVRVANDLYRTQFQDKPRCILSTEAVRRNIPYYKHLEERLGTIVGESEDKKFWRVKWDNNKPTSIYNVHKNFIRALVDD